MPTQSIDFSAVTVANFNGVSLSEILLNGSNVWTAVTIYNPAGFATATPFLIKMPDAFDSDWAGQSVGIDGEIVVCSSNGDDTTGTTGNQGSLNILTTSGAHLVRIPAPAGVVGFSFGSSIKGNKVVSCAVAQNRAWVYSTNGTLLQTLNSPSGKNMGTVSSISDTVIVVGNYASASVHVYDANTYAFKYYLPNPLGDGSSGEWGRFLSCTDDYIAISDPIKNYVYVYNASDGSAVSVINCPVADTGGLISRFGAGVDIFDNQIVIGAMFAPRVPSYRGRAWIFNINGTLIHSLTPANPNSHAFGVSAGFDGETIVIGAEKTHFITSTNNETGSAHVFNAVTGSEIREIGPPSSGQTEYYGRVVGVSGNDIICSASNNDNPYNSGGYWIWRGA